MSKIKVVQYIKEDLDITIVDSEGRVWKCDDSIRVWSQDSNLPDEPEEEK